MKKIQEIVSIKKSKVKRLVALNLAVVLAVSAATTAAVVVAQNDGTADKTNRLINHEHSGLGRVTLQGKDNDVATRDGQTTSYPPLTSEESNSFYRELLLIQIIINNNLKGMTLQAADGVFPAIRGKTVTLSEAPENFAKDLGVTGTLASLLFEDEINPRVNNSPSFADGGRRLREGLMFTYSRSPLTSDGPSHVIINVWYRGNNENEIINLLPEDFEESSIEIAVTGLGVDSDPFSPAEISRFRDQLDLIQDFLTGLEGLTLQVKNADILPPITTTSVGLNDLQQLEKIFANQLGISGPTWINFVKNLDTILDQKLSYSNSGTSLRSGLIFTYSRTGLLEGGIARASIGVTYKTITDPKYIAPSDRPALLDVKVLEREGANADLNPEEIAQFTEQLNAIQTKINALQGLALTVNVNNFPAINPEKIVSFNNARSEFVNDLGLVSENATTFFTQIEQILTASSSHTALGNSLIDGIRFQYIRTGLNHSGSALAMVKVVYVSPTAQHIRPTVTTAELSIVVNGSLSQGGVESDLRQTTVNTELARIGDLHLIGEVINALPAVTDQVVTDLESFGINYLSLDNVHYIYQISHVAISKSGYYPITIKVILRADQSIRSDLTTFLVLATISPSDGGKATSDVITPGTNNFPIGYVVGGVLGALGVIVASPFIASGIKTYYNNYKARTGAHRIVEEEIEMRELQAVANQESWSTLVGEQPLVEPVASSTPLLQDAAPIHDSALWLYDGSEGAIGQAMPQEEQIADEAAVLARQDQIGRTQAGAFNGLGERPLEAELGLVGAAEVDPLIGPALGRPLPALPTSTVNTLLRDAASENELNGILEICNMGEDYAMRLNGHFGAATTERVLQTVSDFSYVAARIQVAGGVTSIPGFSELPTALQHRIAVTLEQFTHVRGTSTLETAAILRNLGSEINDITAEVLAAVETRGLALSSGTDILGSLFGRVINFAENGGLDIVEGLVLVSTENAAEDGIIAFLEHLI